MFLKHIKSSLIYGTSSLGYDSKIKPKRPIVTVCKTTVFFNGFFFSFFFLNFLQQTQNESKPNSNSDSFRGTDLKIWERETLKRREV